LLADRRDGQAHQRRELVGALLSSLLEKVEHLPPGRRKSCQGRVNSRGHHARLTDEPRFSRKNRFILFYGR
jgi:hypothetical protein